MKAAQITEYGGPDVIQFSDVPKPVPGPGQVLVKLAATSFNPADIGDRSGAYRQVRLPFVLGFDAAGTVQEAGSGVTTFSPGDTLIARLDSGGAAAEYAVVDEAIAARAPTTVPLADAAAIPLAGLTAWQAIHDHAELRENQRILINGAGGGVGGYAIQLAKHVGAHVIATASARSATKVRALGADEVIDYTATHFAEALSQKVHVALNLVPLPPEAVRSLASVVRPDGVVVSITNEIDVPASAGPRSVRFIAQNKATDLDELVSLVDKGRLTIDISERLPLPDLADVHRRSERGEIRGKIILIPGP
ncbi:NADP-dependent oxidoreductase [Phytoactinopolyspora mesophila]|uniref:Zinc-binding dehydrogenase n=1 Tax=Phytoactinopolyspora mesophila TaxID=2650750 RepID=A0A7K3M8I6_9ACTN|nr:NADP-dependent oxidoreductase [Phytoactinopolyspora mesophila]NDL59500.1 zinc-binding dehydrogenase [Phytoactinopolyspora mesophila]